MCVLFCFVVGLMLWCVLCCCCGVLRLCCVCCGRWFVFPFVGWWCYDLFCYVELVCAVVVLCGCRVFVRLCCYVMLCDGAYCVVFECQCVCGRWVSCVVSLFVICLWCCSVVGVLMMV